MERIIFDTAEELKAAIIDMIDSSMPPPNAPSTIRQKGHGRTLIDSGRLKKSIGVKSSRSLFGDLNIFVGVIDPEVEKYAKLVHDGTRDIPARPFVSKAVDEMGGQILDRAEQRILDELESQFLK